MEEDPIDVIEFIEVYETRMESSGIPISEWSQKFSCCVPAEDKYALRWIRQNVSHLRWADAKSALISHYQTPEIEEILRIKFRQISMLQNETIC